MPVLWRLGALVPRVPGSGPSQSWRSAHAGARARSPIQPHARPVVLCASPFVSRGVPAGARGGRRGREDLDRAGLSVLVGEWGDPTWLGAGRDWAGSTRLGADTTRHRRLAGYRAGARGATLSGLAGR